MILKNKNSMFRKKIISNVDLPRVCMSYLLDLLQHHARSDLAKNDVFILLVLKVKDKCLVRCITVGTF